jgi:signal transduction histidine kinase
MHLSLLPVLDAASLAFGAAAAYVARLRVRRIRARYEAALAAVDRDPRESARRAFVNLARRIQAVVNRQLRELREMESRHGADAAVFGDLLHLDHGAALIGRLADSLAVLGGDRPGRRWSRPIPVLAVLRGAMSRITEYRRVEIGPLPERVALEGEFAEPLIHAMAELLDNATRYSPPESRVQVNAYNVLNGLVIEVMDAGVGMGPHALARAELALATEGVGFELSALGQTPRLGLAVVGRLAAVAGFEVALESPGSGGGVRAVVRVPAALLREIREVQEITGPPMELATRAAAQTTDIAEAPAPARAQRPTAFTAQGLPRRRRFTGEVASPSASLSAPQSGSRSPASPTAPTSDRPPGLWLSAFHAAVHGDENGARQ